MKPFVSIVPSPSPDHKWDVVSHIGIESRCKTDRIAVHQGSLAASFYRLELKVPSRLKRALEEYQGEENLKTLMNLSF